MKREVAVKLKVNIKWGLGFGVWGLGFGVWGLGLREHYDSGRCDEARTSSTIRDTLETTGELVCPHTAVGIAVASDHLGAVPMITLATAHPAKFPDAVEEATGQRPPLPPHMADLYDRPERLTRVTGDLAEIQSIIRERTRA